MNKFAAFLRGINVGGRHIVPMENLRRMLASLGLKNVKTYIQSGNAIFETKETDAEKLTAKIERKLQSELGFEVKTMLRTIDELKEIARKNPFREDGEKVTWITLLSGAPDAERKRAVRELSTDLEIFRVEGRTLYSSLNRTVKKSLFTNNFTEKHLKVSGTTRNTRTLDKMIALGSEE